ncbi:PREDICTED: surfeit locus protein 6 [Gekko japonicus]|uniref:Surfeit locus protein 6 n=1 Tax=Gekko japonicus TaxID=146911 RepID=A0ABM1KTP8_GEKJA|nr:PREDICTED: surfeit locus protein 6 [Gekko japonicus]XP_015277085.1 PREDICTED: surfeit locus protein 6 [Gekko japonicus]XP_015277086.1 PREDICTED: surfeit locus protein 6 [Gekko japonicus]
MASLANKDSYLQQLAKKICAQEVQEPRKRKFGPGSGEDDAQPKKKKKRKKLKQQAQGVGGAPPGKPAVTDAFRAQAKPTAANAKKSGPGVSVASGARRPAAAGGNGSGAQNGITGSQSRPDSFSTMTLLRQRLHEKIQEVSGQGRPRQLSPAALKKQQRRKYEKERKKRRRKELRVKGKTEKKGAGEVSTGAILELAAPKNDGKSNMAFNKVEVHEEQLSKAEKRKEKRKTVKGNLTPLTGKNYKQLLSRLEVRKNKLEDLKDKDEKKAQELETKMRWTNVLYKAEGVKIHDDENRLKKAVKRKEQRKTQRQKQWEKRTEQVVEKMQQRQDKRRKNLQKKKLAKMERKKSKARKRGRVLPEDLEKAGSK